MNAERETLVAAAKMGTRCWTCREAANTLTILGHQLGAARADKLAEGLREIEQWIAEQMADQAMQTTTEGGQCLP